ncbi:MAG: isocitrate lyase/PEP mutase family protein, partial [Solirubrobacteraceae bacterium]
ATAVADAGFPVVATSSRAIAQLLGEADDDTSDPEVIFAFIARIARAVSAPVTADLEAGYRLPAPELVDRILAAGVAGCNLEDSDHHGGGVLMDAERQAVYLADVRAAADKRRVHIVINARVDTFIQRSDDQSNPVADTVRRACLYLEAGADCVYPIAVSQHEDAAALTQAIPGPVNLLARRGGLTVAALIGLGARRISFGSGIFGLLGERHAQILQALARGDDL